MTKRRAAVRGAVAGLSTIAQCIAVPHDHPAQRLPSFPNLERTAVMPMLTTGTMSVSSASSKEVALFRSPSYPLWSPVSSSNASLYYALSGAAYIPSGAIGALDTTIQFPIDWLEAQTPQSAGTDTAFTSAYQGLYVQGKTKDGRVFAKTATTGYTGMEIVFSATLTSGSFRMYYEIFDGNEFSISYIDVTTTGGVSRFYAMSNADPFLGTWFRPVYLIVTNALSSTVTIANLYFGCSGAAALVSPSAAYWQIMLPFAAPPEIGLSSLPYQATRSTACAALFSNATAVLSKEGTIAAARVPRSTSTGIWRAGTWAAGQTGVYTSLINDVHARDRYYGLLEKGLYTYTLPDESSARFADHYGEGVIKGKFDLEGYDYAHLIVLSDLDSGSTTTLAVTVDNHLEFRSTSMLFPVGYSRSSLESYHVAQMALAEQGVFYENPLHLAAIGTLVRSAVAKLAPIVMPYARQAAVAVGSHLVNAATSRIGNAMGTQISMVAPQKVKRQQKPKSRKGVRVASKRPK